MLPAHRIVVLSSFVLLFSCQNSTTGPRVTNQLQPSETVISDTRQRLNTAADFPGTWEGPFQPADESGADGTSQEENLSIAITIDSMRDGMVKGRSAVEGNERPFQGTYTISARRYAFVTEEPGNDDHDGIFRFEAALGDSVISGTWTAFQKGKMPVMKYELAKQKPEKK